MADKKVKTTKKDEKPSVEEIRKRKEEVLRRLDAEIGDATPDEDEKEVVIEQRIEVVETQEEAPEVKESEEESKEKIEEELLASDKVEEKVEELKEEKSDASEEVIEETEDKTNQVEEDEIKATEEEKTPPPFSAAEFGLADKSGNKSKNIILFLIVFLIVAVFSAAFYFYFTGAFSPKEEQVSETAPTATPSPSPTPEEFDRASLSVQVLNGSGVGGAAGDMQSILEDLGYKSIEVGNADNTDYENVTIQLKSDFEKYFENISSDIEEDYVVNEDFETLNDDSEYDVVIIVGSEAEEDTSTAPDE